MTPAELAAIRERVEHTLPDFSMVGQHMAERDRAALLSEVERLHEEMGRVLLDRAEHADAAQKARDHLAGLRDMASAVAKVTPCACSAQRARADRAEARLDKVRAVADAWERDEDAKGLHHDLIQTLDGESDV